MDALHAHVTHLSPPGLHRNPAYSQAVVVEGPARTIYVGGQNAVTEDGRVVGAGDLRAQTQQIFKNLETLLAASGAALHDIVKFTVFVVHGQDIRPGFEVFQQVWGNRPNPPIVTAAFVAALAHPDFLVEIEAIAVTGVGGTAGPAGAARSEERHGG